MNDPITTKKQLQLKLNVVTAEMTSSKEIVQFVKFNLEDTTPVEMCFISVQRLCAIGTQWYAIGDVFEKN